VARTSSYGSGGQNERLVSLLADTVAALQDEQALAREGERITEEFTAVPPASGCIDGIGNWGVCLSNGLEHGPVGRQDLSWMLASDRLVLGCPLSPRRRDAPGAFDWSAGSDGWQMADRITTDLVTEVVVGTSVGQHRMAA